MAEVFLEELNMPHDYSKEQFTQDFNALISEGLVEVVGINPRGEWLYGITEKGHKFWKTMSAFEETKNFDD